jgi:endoribonuclease Dicer
MAGGSDSEEPPAASSYWYDACEDGASLLCGIDFAASADFHPGIIPAIDCGADPTPATPTPAPASLPPPPQDAAAVVANNAAPVVDNVQTSQSAELWKEPRRELPVAAANGGGGELRDGKRQRLAAGAPRHDWRRPPLPPPPAP